MSTRKQNNMEILAIIPARKGSKGMPGKNKIELCGKPMISYSIEAAKSSDYISSIVITTDDNDIREIGLKYNIDTVSRPVELSEDETPMLPVLIHALKNCMKGGINPEIVVLLQPTSPLRLAEDIDNVLDVLIKGGFNSAVSVRKLDINPFGMVTLDYETKRISYYLESRPAKHPRRQDLPPIYRYNGAVWATKTQTLTRLTNHVIDPNSCGAHIMPDERSIDIDCTMDLILAEFILRNNPVFKICNEDSKTLIF